MKPIENLRRQVDGDSRDVRLPSLIKLDPNNRWDSPPLFAKSQVRYGYVVYRQLPDQTGGRITEKKEKAASAISQKHGFSLYAPPDAGGKYSSLRRDAPSPPHHHLELSYDRESIIVFHPYYLKIRLFRTFGITQHACNPSKALPSVLGLLQELSALYQARGKRLVNLG